MQQPVTNQARRLSPTTKACPMCGEEILRAAKKCKHCGEYLTADAKRQAAPQPSSYQWTPGRIILLLVGLAGLGFLFWYFSMNGGILRSLF